MISVDRDESFAPGCFLVCRARKATDWRGLECWEWDPHDLTQTVRIELGPGWIELARRFGWSDEERDGYQTEADLIKAAEAYLDGVIEEGRVVEDRWYFQARGRP